ncbi:MAG: hypothetical protein IJH34_09115, partial [Romboutsia sp.]|nr:hypothetical protein [Romboutsia sp.]
MKYKYMTSVGVIGIVVFVGIMSILTPDKETSELDGRTLQTLPSIKWNFKETLDGSFFKEWDSYFSDHIFKRDTIVNAYSSIQDTLDKKYVNGVYLGEDEYVFTLNEVKGMTDSKLENSAEHFNKIADKFSNAKSYLVNLPQKSMIYE